MAIAQVGTAVEQSNAAGATAGNLVVNVPSGVANGHLLIACVFKADDGVHTLTAPAGWTLIGSADASANIQSKMYYRVASSEPANYTWTISAAGIWGVSQLAFSGVDTSSPINASASNSSTTTDPYSCPNLTTTLATNVISFGASRDDSTTEVTHTGSDTLLSDWGNDGGASTRNGAVFLSAQKAAGSVTGLSINPSGSITNSVRWSVALNITPVTGTASATTPSLTSVFDGDHRISGDVVSQLPSITSLFDGVATPPSGTVDTVLPSISSLFAGGQSHGSITSQLPSITSDWVGGQNHGAVDSSLPLVTVTITAGTIGGSLVSALPSLITEITGESRKFGEHVIVVEAEGRAFRVTDDGTGLVPIKRSQVTLL